MITINHIPKKIKIIVTVIIAIVLITSIKFVFVSKKQTPIDYQLNKTSEETQIDKKTDQSNEKTIRRGVFLPVENPDKDPTDEFGDKLTFDIDVEKNIPYDIMLFHHFGINPVRTTPFVAVGYDYNTGEEDTTKFSSVTLPNNGDGIFDIYLYNGSSFYLAQKDILAGTTYNFKPGGVSRFRILGITPDTKLNSTSSSNFITRLTFTDTGNFRGIMIPIITTYP